MLGDAGMPEFLSFWVAPDGLVYGPSAKNVILLDGTVTTIATTNERRERRHARFWENLLLAHEDRISGSSLRDLVACALSATQLRVYPQRRVRGVR